MVSRCVAASLFLEPIKEGEDKIAVASVERKPADIQALHGGHKSLEQRKRVTV
jgi:hypothetical protein